MVHHEGLATKHIIGTSHRRGAGLSLVRTVPVPVDAAAGKCASHVCQVCIVHIALCCQVMLKMERWISEHRQDPRRSRLKRLVPQLGNFFTSLKLVRTACALPHERCCPLCVSGCTRLRAPSHVHAAQLTHRYTCSISCTVTSPATLPLGCVALPARLRLCHTPIDCEPISFLTTGPTGFEHTS